MSLPNRRSSACEAGSLYTDANLDITDTVKLTAGVRYSEETKSYIRTNFNRLTGAVASVESNRKSFHSTNPRLGIEWRPIPGLLLFATATSGFKSRSEEHTSELQSIMCFTY